MFIDRVKIKIKAGNGGNGCTAFRREKHVPRGGPSGGNGGKGGNVILQVDKMMTTLIDFYYISIYKAKKGVGGGGSDKTGANGQDLIIKVPPGTIVNDVESEKVIADLVDGEYIVAKGGKGGRGNASYKTSSNKAPQYSTEGQPGEERELLLELKTIADIGLVGAPNAGKSTFLSKVSLARPKIAEYPFTTIEPNLGIAELDRNRRVIFCDIPGLIEDAHKGKGLGLDFLRHVERNILLFIFVDLFDNPQEKAQMIKTELESYSLGILSHKTSVLVGTKADVASEENIELIKNMGGSIISSITGQGLKELLELGYSIIEKQKAEMDGDYEGR